jgi:hypothetical protein
VAVSANLAIIVAAIACVIAAAVCVWVLVWLTRSARTLLPEHWVDLGAIVSALVPAIPIGLLMTAITAWSGLLEWQRRSRVRRWRLTAKIEEVSRARLDAGRTVQ